MAPATALLTVALALAADPALPPGAVLRFEPLPTTAGEPARLTHLVLSPDGDRLHAAAATGEIGIWSVQTGRRLETLSVADDRSTPHALQLSHSGGLQALAGTQLVRFDEGPQRQSLKSPPAAVAATFSHDGRLLAVCGGEPPIILYDAATGKPVRQLDPTTSADRLAFSPDDAFLAGARSWRLCLWNSRTGDEIWRQRLEGTVRGFAFSPDGSRIFADVDYEGIMLIETATGRARRTLPRPGIPALGDSERRALAVSPDESLLAETGPQGVIVVWEVFTGRRVLSLAGHEGLVTGLAFLPDGRRLVSIGDNGTAMLWDLHAQSLVPPEFAASSLSQGQLEQLWRQLGDESGAQAYPAFLALLHHPEQTLRVIESPPGTEELVHRLIARLDDADSSVRADAYRNLKGLSVAAEPLLRERLERRTSAEAAARIHRLLSRLRGRKGERERLETMRRHRLLRSAHLLKWIGTPEARALLDELETRTDDPSIRAEIETVRGTLDKTPSE